MTHWPALGIVLWAGVASAQPAEAPAVDGASGPVVLPAAFERIEKALPPGWTMLATGSELVFRHDKPCYFTGVRHENAPSPEAAVHASKPAPPSGPLVTVELRYKLEPRWTEKQLAAAKATNHKVADELRALSAKYKIEEIHHSKGRPLPANADEQSRLSAYDSEHARVAKRLVALPRCSAGDLSVFDGEDTYAQLDLEIDPPEVSPEAHKVIELMKQHCR